MHPRLTFAALAGLLLVSVLPCGPAFAQCILANPSFEIGGSGGATFGGWNQFGTVGSTSLSHHGARAARVIGPNQGSWDVSGFWQSQTSEPGEQWEITGHVRHPSVKPLTGQCVALVNVEWRDGAGALIDYDSYTVADASSPADQYLDFSLLSGPAPAGTATARLLLGVLQSPAAASPDVYYDQVTFYSTTSPTIDDQQWNDFPGGRTLSFAGRTWRVKGPGVYGPGVNYFSIAPDRVWVDGSGQLHLTLKSSGGTWASTEVVVDEALGYGDYILTTVGRPDLLDPQAVLGIFLWEYGTCWDNGYLWWNAFNEIDIEYSRWGNAGANIGQFVAQPYDYPGNISRFAATFAAGEVASHAMRWLPDRVEYRVWRGGPDDESPANLVAAWTYAGPHIPRPEQPRMHLNLWKLAGTPAANQEIVFQDFTFVPEGNATGVQDDIVHGTPAVPAGLLRSVAPNPFNPRTTVRFELTREGPVQLEVFDLEGRRVRTLVDGWFTAGPHTAEWDGLDGEGGGVGSGVYLFQLRGDGYVETRQVTLIR
ncbi:MAG: FlgD immunoglobulin-like domain containing protein [Candidatus Latescibacteria bacterium]|nr:FlgD immunoglobulin-like domain containing protein [Candidatus Latescibacterota bacterium]